MARHNRKGEGSDQRGFIYEIGYQPDWLRHVKVSRQLPSGRQSTMTLFRNPSPRAQARPGPRVRTTIASPEQGVDVEVVVRNAHPGVRRVAVSCIVPAVDGNGEEEVVFTIENRLPPPPSGPS